MKPPTHCSICGTGLFLSYTLNDLYVFDCPRNIWHERYALYIFKPGWKELIIQDNTCIMRGISTYDQQPFCRISIDNQRIYYCSELQDISYLQKKAAKYGLIV